jgi:hypothetical protein
MHYATSQNDVGSIPDEVIGYLNRPNPSSHIMDLGSTQPLREKVPGIFLGVKVPSGRKADNLTAICELIA